MVQLQKLHVELSILLHFANGLEFVSEQGNVLLYGIELQQQEEKIPGDHCVAFILQR